MVWVLMISFLYLLSCSQENPLWDYLGSDVYVAENIDSNVLREITFFGAEEDGSAWGFDLDGLVSVDGEEESCGHGDQVDPNGNDGIDNQLAQIWTFIEPVAGSISQELLQGSINEGRFLLMLEIVDADSLVDADDVSLNIFSGIGDPEIGTMGFITPHQTFSIDPEAGFTTLTGLSIRDGVLEAGPVDYSIPLDILELSTTLNIQNGVFRVEIAEDGTFTGYMGGALSVSEFLEDIKATDAAEEAALVEALFVNNADMGFDGDSCDLFSMALQFSGTHAFVTRETSE